MEFDAITTPPYNFREGAVLLIDKPLHWTSFDVVNKVRYAIKEGPGKKGRIKVGHAGTLDPLATGLLILCTGKMTKQIDTIQAIEKVYTGTFILGATTPTYDAEQEPDQTFDISAITPEAVLQTAQQFVGEIEQLPPVYSALKVDGTPAYKKARQGEHVALKPRKITIHELEITHIDLPKVAFRVRCSKGTYIRSLAHDIGKALNNGAYLSELCRTAIGEYTLDKAWKLEDFINFARNNGSTPSTGRDTPDS